MPCRTDYMDDPPARPNMKDYVERSTYKEVKEEADLTTRLLCDIFKFLDTNNYTAIRGNMLTQIKDLEQWKKKHDKQDRARLEKMASLKLSHLSNEQIQKILDGTI